MRALCNRLFATSAVQTTRVDGGPTGRPRGASIPPYLVSTRSHVRGARGKPRIARVRVALGAGARRAAAPRLSRRRLRGRACAAAATHR